MDKEIKQKIEKKKISQTKVWPSIIAFIIFGLIAFLVLDVLVVSYVGTSLTINLDDNITDYISCKNLILDPSNTTKEDRLEDYNLIAKYNSNINDVVLLDSNFNIIEQYGSSECLDFNNKEFSYINPVNNFTCYVDSSLFEYAGDSNISLDDSKIFNVISDIAINKPIKTNLWYLFSTDSGYIAVMHTNEINSFNGYSLIGMILILFFVFILFFTYHITTLVINIRRNKRLLYVLYTDPVTEGHNFLYFTKYSEKYIIKNRNNKKSTYNYALVNIRMDKYRHYLTTNGTDAADELFKMFDKKLNELIDKKEIVARYDKSEFALLLKLEKKPKLEKRIKTMVSSMQNSVEDNIQLSVGIAKVTKTEYDTIEVFNHACLARREVLDGDDKRLAWFTDEIEENIIWEHIVESEMDKALANNEFKVYIQPKYTPSGKLGGGEALIRWISEERGFVGPNKFIPIFENNGFIIKIDDFMISEVANHQATWLKKGYPIVPISVNVSRAHFAMSNLANHIAKLVDKQKCPHEYIELELTESAFFDDKATLLNTVKKMRELGFKVSMDDFGAGYSSLNSLKELPLDVIKIDAEFFRNVVDQDRADIIVRETIDLAKKLGMKTVAEGVEEKPQVEFLAKSGCDLIQGYYFSKPLPVDDYVAKSFSKKEDK